MTQDVITVLFFAWVREIAGTDQTELASQSCPSGQHLKDWLINAFPALEARADQLCLAVNQEHVDWDTLIAPGDEIAVFPPVTGG